MLKLNKIIGLLIFIPSMSLASDYRFDKNQQTVYHWIDVCKASKCSDCGYFYYDDFNNVEYSASHCENEYLFQQEELHKREVDKQIRHKYNKD